MTLRVDALGPDPLDLEHRRPCVGSGACCKRGPCGYGEADESGGCRFLVEWTDAPGGAETTRYRCGKYEEIVKLDTASVMPAFGEGCCQPLFNSPRRQIIHELGHTRDGRVHLAQLHDDLRQRIHAPKQVQMTQDELKAVSTDIVLRRIAALVGRGVFGAIFLRDFVLNDTDGALTRMIRCTLDSDKLFEIVTRQGLDEAQAIETVACSIAHEIQTMVHKITRGG